MPTTLRATLADILDAVEARVVAKTSIPAGRVRQLARHQKESPHLDGDQDVLLRVRGFTADGYGHRDRHDCRVVRKLSVVLRTRLELDETGSDEEWLTNAAGSTVFEEDIIDALQGFHPIDADSNLLTYEPLYVISGDDPNHDAAKGWGEVELLFALPLTLPLEQREE